MKTTGDWNFGIYKVSHVKGENSGQTLVQSQNLQK